MTVPSSAPRTPPPDYSFAQGIVEAWDAIAGTNKVRVRGQVFDDLLSLVGSETGLMRVGDSVIVGRIQNTYAVFGRIEPPGVEQRALGVATDRELTEEDVSTSSGMTWFTLTGGPAVSVYIGSSRRAMVTLSAFVRSYAGVAEVGVRVSGASTIEPNFWQNLSVSGSAPSGFVSVQMSASRLIQLGAADGLNEGLNTFTMVYRFNEDDPTGAGTFADREITVQPF